MRWSFLLLFLSACSSSSSESESDLVVARDVEEQVTPATPGCVPIKQEVILLRGQEPVCKSGELKSVSVAHTFKLYVILRVDCGCVSP